MRKIEKIVLLLFTLINIFLNRTIPFYSDETYYWLWSKKLDFSYFDHPPMVAYLIKLTTLLGDDPALVRLGAPLLFSATAYILYMLAKKMFDEKVAIYTFYIFLTSIIVQGGYTLITPDTPLIFFWAATLYSAYVYIHEDNKKYALLTGIFGGALLLSKYTGIFLLFAILLYIIIYKRSLFKDRYLYLAIMLILLVFSPVLYWNAVNDFISFKFQLGHGIAEEKVFRSKEFFNFVGAQLILLHPFYLLTLFYFIVRDRLRFEREKVFLLIPFLLPLGVFIYFSAFKHANAQWAAPAYLSASILLGYYAAVYNIKKLLIAAGIFTGIVVLLVKFPVAEMYITPVKQLKSRLGKINNFSHEIEAMNLDIDAYDYIFIDDYHGCEVAYYFQKYKNVHVISSARFSHFNIWRNRELGISETSPLTTLPKLGRCIYIGSNMAHYREIEQLFGNAKMLSSMEKKIGKRTLKYYFVEFNN